MRYVMNLFIKEIDEKSAKVILSWKYEKPYDFYNNEGNEEELKELLDEDYKAIINDTGIVFGFLCTGKPAQIPIGQRCLQS